jgi:hypothetical protein
LAQDALFEGFDVNRDVWQFRHALTIASGLGLINSAGFPETGTMLSSNKLLSISEGVSIDQKREPEISYQIRVKPGREGVDPEAPDWEVLELEDGVVMNNADIYDNLTLAEANQIAGMWRRKKAEAEADPTSPTEH